MQEIFVDAFIRTHSYKDVWLMPKGNYKVIFHDGELIMNRKDLFISRFYWEAYNIYPEVPVTVKAAIRGTFISSTHTSICETIIWGIFNTINDRTKCSIWDLSKIEREIANNMYNMYCICLSEYITSASLHDVIEILEEPIIVEAKKEYQRLSDMSPAYSEKMLTPSITDVKKAVGKVLYDSPEYLKSNGIKKLTMAGLVNRGQIEQIIGPRGYVLEIDNTLLPYPIDVGYAEGLTTLYDSAVESRSASRHYMMTEKPLSDSEYFNRKVQIAATVITDFEIILGGCQGYVTVPWLVAENDSVLLKGKFHMEDGEPKLIWDNIKPLVGKVVNLRSLTGCNHPDPQKVCGVCLGWKEVIIPPLTNLGFDLSTPLCSNISSRMLGTKHHESSGICKPLNLDSVSSKWFKKDSKSPDLLFFTEQAVKHKILIRVNSEYVKMIDHVQHIDVSELSIETISKIPELGIAHLNKDGSMSGIFDTVKLNIDGNGVHLSQSILKYIKFHGWASGRGYIEFTLDDWNFNKPVFVIPKIGDNIMVFFEQIRTYLEGGEKSSDLRLTSFKTRAKAIAELVAILRRKLVKNKKDEFNILQVEIFIRALMVQSIQDNKFGLPRANDQWEFLNLKSVISNRTITGMMALEKQSDYIFADHWFTHPTNIKHLLDPLLGDNFS